MRLRLGIRDFLDSPKPSSGDTSQRRNRKPGLGQKQGDAQVKYLKTLMLAAVAAAALTALFGAGTASATELCSTSTTPCSGTKYGANTTLHGVLEAGTTATLTTSITTVHCNVSTVHGNTTTAGGAGISVNGDINALNFTGCTTSSGTACNVAAVNLPYPATISGGGTAAGAASTLTVSDPSGAGALVVSGNLINCTFTSTDATLNVANGASTPTAKANVVLNRAGGICPNTSTWEASYVLDTPDP